MELRIGQRLQLLTSIAECRTPRFEVERGDNWMVAREPDLLPRGHSHDGDDEEGDLLKDPFMNGVT